MTNERLELPLRILFIFGISILIFWLGLFKMNDLLADYSQNLRHFTSAVVLSVLTLLLVVWARRFLDQRPWSGIRLSHPRAGWKMLLLGMACFLAPALLILIVSVAAGWTELTLHVSFGRLVLTAGALLVIAFLYEAFPEELIFRGYIHSNLSASTVQWAALMVQALLFALWVSVIRMIGGVSPEVAMEEFALFLFFGLGLGIFRTVTGDVWAAIGLHLAYITFQQIEGPRWGVVTATHPPELLWLGYRVIPFVIAVLLLLYICRRRINRRAGEPKTGSKPDAGS